MLLRSVDLNLIPVLRELLRERSVSRAAANLGLSQSATSAALSRLRTALGDPLLVQVGRRMELTDRAKALIVPVQIASESAEAVWTRREFDPKSAKRRFVIATADYVAIILAPGLISHLRRQAPGLTLQFVDPTRRMVERLRHGEIDFGILPKDVIAPLDTTEIRTAFLLKDEFVAVAAKPRRRQARRREDAFATFRIDLHETPSPAERLIAGHRDPIPVSYDFQQFSVLPFVALEAGLTALVQKRLARKLGRYLPIEIVPPPGPMAQIELQVLWSVARQEDQAHRWFLDLLKRTARAEQDGKEIG
ncbi:MAG TPA: LysR family transcriptional regulator [Rhizomicrobium sp.]|nr:LysR family transcriptional regulator [Rhizomicrobium sp.]